MTMKRYYVGVRNGFMFGSVLLLVFGIFVLTVASPRLFTGSLIDINYQLLVLWIFALVMSIFAIIWIICNLILFSREKLALRGTQTKGIVKRINRTWTRTGDLYSIEIEFENNAGETCISIIPISRYTHDMYKQGETVTVYVDGDYGTISKRR